MGGRPSKQEENGTAVNYQSDNQSAEPHINGGFGGVLTERPQLTEKQIELLRTGWKVVERDVAEVGVIMFIQLFETHPDVKAVFVPYGGDVNEGLKDSKWLREHALRVMGIVEKVLSRIQDEDKLSKLLHELGQRHIQYNAKTDYIELIGVQFIQAIQPALKDQWSSEVEEAWTDLFKLITYIMREGMTT